MRPYYDHAGVTIYHGDCREVLPTLADGSVDLLFTDPPYGLNAEYGRTALGTRTIVGDESLDLALWLVPEMARLLAPERWAAMFCGYSGVGPLSSAIEDAGLVIKTVAVWDKLMPGLGEGIRNQYEQIVLARKGAAKSADNGGNVWRVPRDPGRPEHPHEKPLRVLNRVLGPYSAPGHLVVDPCAGSGRILEAAKNLARQAIGVEIEERYCEIAAKRLAQEVLPL